MEDSEPTENSMSISGGRRSKTCGLCQKVESQNWRRHWRLAHPGLIAFEEGYQNPNPMEVVPYAVYQSKQDRQRHPRVLLSQGVDDFFAPRPKLPP